MHMRDMFLRKLHVHSSSSPMEMELFAAFFDSGTPLLFSGFMHVHAQFFFRMAMANPGFPWGFAVCKIRRLVLVMLFLVCGCFSVPYLSRLKYGLCLPLCLVFVCSRWLELERN